MLEEDSAEEGVERPARVSILRGSDQREVHRRRASAEPDAVAGADRDGISVISAAAAQIG